jgi:phosphatidylglycerol:prolipoprotein diacylglycerol transferase
MYPVIEIFGRYIGTYGLMILCGTTMAFVAARLLAKTWDDWVYAYLFALVFGVIGALLLRPFIKVIGLIFDMSPIRGMSFAAVVASLFGEIVFYGGLVGGILGLLLYCRIFSAKIAEYVPLGAACVPLAHMFGRIGCFFGGCCYGVENSSHNILTVIFPAYPTRFENPYHAPSGVPLVNTQLLEACFLLLLFISQTFIFKRKPIFCLPIYLFAYGIWRFMLEFWRGDAIRGSAAGFTTSQWISLVVCAAGFLIVQHLRRRAFVDAAKYSKPRRCYNLKKL